MLDAAPAGIRRQQDRRDAEPRLPAVHTVQWSVVVTTGRANMVEETAPLVVGDEQRGARPQRGMNECLNDRRQEGLTSADVAERMVIPRAQRAGSVERRIDVGELRQRAGRGVSEKPLEALGS